MRHAAVSRIAPPVSVGASSAVARASLQSGPLGILVITEQPAGGFLLVTMDPLGTRGGRTPAASLVRDRLALGRWPLYECTKNRSAVVAGSRVALYVGGGGPDAGRIVAVARVARKLHSSTPIDPPRYLTERPAYCLVLEQVTYLTPKIDFRERLPLLSFSPKNQQKWGIVLMGGCRALSEADWNLLINAPVDTPGPA